MYMTDLVDSLNEYSMSFDAGKLRIHVPAEDYRATVNSMLQVTSCFASDESYLNQSKFSRDEIGIIEVSDPTLLVGFIKCGLDFIGMSDFFKSQQNRYFGLWK